MNRIKDLLTFLFFVSFSAGYAQSVPVTWSTTTTKINDHQYAIAITCHVPEAWCVYAANDSVNQITGVELYWEPERIKKISGLQKISGNDSVIRDRIFDKKPFRVYGGAFKFIQPVEIEGGITPFLIITIHGFAANGKEFEPIEETRNIHLEGAVFTFQSENFNQVTQPMYVILNPGEQLMNGPVGYTPNATEFRHWLECGLQAFNNF